MKNENTGLKISLEELRTKQRQEDLEEDRRLSEGNEERKLIIPRGECEGKDTRKERQDGKEERKEEIIKTLREDGEGGEGGDVILGERKKKVRDEMKSRERGEAEGEKEIQKKDITEEISQHSADTQTITQMETGEEKFSQETLDLHNQLQQALEEVDRRATLAQDLRSRLAEQSKKVLEAEHKMVYLEAENQRLKRAAETLTEARKQIEVMCNKLYQEKTKLLHDYFITAR